jgi:hypothetical protein
VVSFTPRSLYIQRKSTWYTLDGRQREPQRWSGRGVEEKNSQPLPGLEHPIIQLVAQCYATELTGSSFEREEQNTRKARQNDSKKMCLRSVASVTNETC